MSILGNIVLSNNGFSLQNTYENSENELSIFSPEKCGNLIEHFIQVKANKSIHTAKAYEHDIKEFFGVKDLRAVNYNVIREITVAHAEKYILYLSKQGRSSATIHRKISSLSSLYSWLMNYSSNKSGKSLIYFNPFAGMREVKPTLNSKETEFLTEDEMKKLLSSINTDSEKGLRDYIIITLALTTALRKSEMINIRINDVQAYEGIYIIKVKRKGSRNSAVKIQPKLKNLIEDYINFSNRELESNDFLFKGYGKVKADKLSPDSLNRILTSLCQKAGIKKKLTVHGLRHSAITLSLIKGATLEKVRDFAGHKNIATTNRYLHSLDKFKNYAGDLIDIL